MGEGSERVHETMRAWVGEGEKNESIRGEGTKQQTEGVSSTDKRIGGGLAHHRNPLIIVTSLKHLPFRFLSVLGEVLFFCEFPYKDLQHRRGRSLSPSNPVQWLTTYGCLSVPF